MQALDIITEIICDHLEEKYEIALVADAPDIYLALYTHYEPDKSRFMFDFKLEFEADCLNIMSTYNYQKFSLPYCYPNFIEDLDKICTEHIVRLHTNL